MPKFTLIAEHENANGNVESRITSEFRAELWDDALTAFEEFLRGTGYYFDGHFELVNADDSSGADAWSAGRDWLKEEDDVIF